MTRFPIFAKALRDVRVSIVGYGVGLAALAAMYVFLFPSFSDQFSDFELPEAYAAFIGDIDAISEPRGFIQTEFFSFMVPLILVIFAIVAGTGQLAGDEQAGTLELVLAHPVSRRRVLLERMAALLTATVLICALAGLGFVVSVPFVDLGELGTGELILTVFAFVPFGAAFISLAVLLAVAGPTRGQAAGLMSLVALLSYLFSVLPDLASSLEPLRYGSLFYWGDTKTVLMERTDPVHLAVLVGVTAVATLLALRVFEGREIGSARWQLGTLFHGAGRMSTST